MWAYTWVITLNQVPVQSEVNESAFALDVVCIITVQSLTVRPDTFTVLRWISVALVSTSLIAKFFRIKSACVISAFYLVEFNNDPTSDLNFV